MLSDIFRVILLVGVLIYLLIIMLLMRKGKMNLKYSLVWLLSGVVMLVCAAFPGVVHSVAKLFGVYSDVNIVFFVGVCFLLVIILSLTSIVSLLSDRLRSLTQTQAILEKRVRELEQRLAHNMEGKDSKES